MTARREFTRFLTEQLAGFGEVSIRKMFGGAGIYRAGLMFALVADDTLYFKADALTRAEFEAEGREPFGYQTGGGRNVIMSYWQAPERCLDDPDEMAAWARKAYDAALRARKPARRRGN